MADRERSSRPATEPSSSVHPLAFLPNLFGRRTTVKASSADARKASASSSVTRTSIDEVAQPLPNPPAGSGSSQSAAPFHLDAALALMQPGGTKSTAELVEIVKASSVHLANTLLEHSPNDASPLSEMGLRPGDLRQLYEHAMTFSDPKQDYALRTAAIRLLAVLLSAAPPPDSVLHPNPADLPASLTSRSIYRVITAASGGTPGPAATNQIFVEVAALKVLTREGTMVEGMEGIIGWLLRTLNNMLPDWVQWCAQPDDNSAESENRESPFGPIKTATPAASASAIIDLITAIVDHRTPLFSPSDLTRIVHPVIDFLWQGMVVSVGTTAPPLKSELSSASISRRQAASAPAVEGQVKSNDSTPAPSRHSTGGRVPMNSRRATSLTVTPMSAMTSLPSRSPVRASASRQVKWSSPFKSLVALAHMLFETTTITDELFEEVFELVAFTFGQDDKDALVETSTDTGASTHDLVRTMLGARSGRRGELALRKALEGKLVVSNVEGRKGMDVDRKVARGAIIVARLCDADPALSAQSNRVALSFSNLSSSLVEAVSASRYPGEPSARAAEWAKWRTVDAELLSFLDSHLSSLEVGNAETQDADDVWTEGEAVCEILDSLQPVITGLAPATPRSLLKGEGDPLVASFGNIAQRVPHALGNLNIRLHSSKAGEQGSSSAPSANFFHPKYVELLLGLGEHLDEDTASLVVDYYQRECLCLPFTTGWIKNIWRLLEAFGMSYELPVARIRVSHLLYQDVYGYVDDLPEHRAQLVDEVLIPYLKKWLQDETDDSLLSEALGVLVSAAVSETQERDDERRRARVVQAAADAEAEDASALPSQEIVDVVSGGSFAAIREILTKLAIASPCKGPSAAHASHASIGSMISRHDEGRNSREGRPREPGGLRGLMRTLSPAREPASPPPNMSAVLSPPPEDPSPPPQVDSLHQRSEQHLKCKSLHAVKSLIAIFTRLAFTTPSSQTGKPLRTPASARCIEIYRDLLHLLYSINDGTSGGRPPAKCPRARLVILQWAMRLRADRKHRILFRDDINRFVKPFAQTLFRTKESEEQMRSQMEADEARRRARTQAVSAATPGREEPRGRSARPDPHDSTARSRSQSKVPATLRRTAPEPQSKSYDPLWCLPETLSFEAPPDNHPSEGLLTYDPNHPSLQVENAPLVEGVWLPVSEYVRVLNGILRWEHDWELVSYVLCFLPQQLGNKHFFHGTRATREIRGLLRVLCDGILEPENRWERRYNVPAFIKRTHINSVAYQAISILISYRSVFERAECDRLIQSLVYGLEGHALLAKPCLQALTIAIYELDQYVSRQLLTILQKMQQILSITAVAVHILEFLVALGNSNLYRNFTDDQYRLVFAVAIGYIAEHNARTDQPMDFAANRDAYTLSQHVIGLAYHAIYLWFLAVKVPQRPQHVSYLIKGLLHAKSNRGTIDERTEVCFDWLARYTYGNADPKPATSFLSEIVMRNSPNEDSPPKTLSWLLGGALVTVTAHQRTGWATISTTRPTGQTSVVCKLENVPFLGLGEDVADLNSLPAVLMANRERKRDVNDQEAKVEELEDDNEKVDNEKVQSGAPSRKASDDSSRAGDDKARAIVSAQPREPAEEEGAGYVWSGAAPSQRRKDVMVEPSYLALQLLSSYPNASLSVPRGQLIPREGKFERALRGIEKTAVINTSKIAVLYVGPGQKTETEIFGNVDGSPLFLDFLAGLGRIIRLKGQEDVYTGGLDRENDTDGQYAYAWWDDLAQIIFHTPTLMPNIAHFPEYTNKKRLVGNDFVKIVYNESGNDFAFDTIKTAFNFVNIIISPYATRDVADAGSLVRSTDDTKTGTAVGPTIDDWGGDSEDFFKVVLQRADGIPDFSPIGEYKLVSRKNLPILVRQIAHYANNMAMRFQHVQAASDATGAEFITIWRARWRAMQRLRDMYVIVTILLTTGFHRWTPATTRRKQKRFSESEQSSKHR